MSGLAFETVRTGDLVRIVTGLAGGQVGTVTSRCVTWDGPVVYVEVSVPVLLLAPHGPRHLLRLPYAPCELEDASPPSASNGPVCVGSGT